MEEAHAAHRFDPVAFRGSVRLLLFDTLPLLPGAAAALRVEEASAELAEAAAADDRLIALGLASPATPSFACLARIEALHRLTDGGVNLMLSGVARVAIDAPSAPGMVRAEIVPSTEPSREVSADLQGKLLTALRATAEVSDLPELLAETLQGVGSLGALVDLVLSALPLPVQEKLAALVEPDAAARAERLLVALEHRTQQGSTAPRPN